MARIKGPASKWTPPAERLAGDRLIELGRLKQTLKATEAKVEATEKETEKNDREIEDLRDSIQQLRADLPKALHGAGGGRKTIRKVLLRDGADFLLPVILEAVDGALVPDGGTTGQMLVKASNDDQDTAWASPTVGSHTHTVADITDFATASAAIVLGAVGVVVQAYDADLTAWAGVNPSSYLTSSQIAAGYQPLATVLTNTTASFTTTLLSKLNGIASGATANDTDANLKARANHTGSQLASTISDFSTAADARISSAVGSTVQAYHANLAAFAGLSLIADRLPYANGSGTLALATLTAAGRALMDDADASAQLTTLGVSAFAKTLVDDADASTVLSTLGVSAFAKTILDDADAATARTTLGLASGTWTPTLTAEANFTSPSAVVCMYSRIGDIVTCAGAFSATLTAAAGTSSVMSISLPIASDLTAFTDCLGTATAGNAQRGGRIAADTTNNVANFTCAAEVTGAISFYFNFQYRVI